jgi:hypothetical protein
VSRIRNWNSGQCPKGCKAIERERHKKEREVKNDKAEIA